MSTAHLHEVEEELKMLAIQPAAMASGLPIDQRPVGTLGKPISLISNCFDVEWGVPYVYLYHVAFDPDIPQDETVHRILALRRFDAEV